MGSSVGLLNAAGVLCCAVLCCAVQSSLGRHAHVKPAPEDVMWRDQVCLLQDLAALRA